MMGAGAVERVMTAWMSIGLPWGVSKVMRHYVESGAVALEEWSHLALGLRFRAAAMGVPFVPALTMLGSDLVAVGGMKTVADPYSGETLAAVPALFPDVALLHVHRADRFGNCQIDGYPHMDADIARAAATVLVTTEELMTDDETRRHPDRTVIPGFLVDALVHVPFGAFPHECYGLYEADFDHFGDYTSSIDARGPEAAVADYLARYVYAPSAWDDYLDLFGGELPEQATRGPSRPRGPRYNEATPHLEQATRGPSRPRGTRYNDPAIHVRRTLGHHGLARAARRHDGVRGRRGAAAGGGAGAAAPRAESHDGDRGRHHRAAHQARAAADLHERDARGPSGTDAAGDHRYVLVRAARVPGLRLHGRRADRPVRQRQHERARHGLLEAEGPPARHRRGERHRIVVQGGHHSDRARETPVRAARGLRDEPGVRGGAPACRSAASRVW